MEIGEKILVHRELGLNPLPEYQQQPKNGVYQLRYIPIDKTDIIIKGKHNKTIKRKKEIERFKYIRENFDSLPPIIFEENEDGTYSHLDGYHRVIIGKELGKKEMLSYVRLLDQSLSDIINIEDIKIAFEVNNIENFNNVHNWVFLYNNRVIPRYKAIKYLNHFYRGDKIIAVKKKYFDIFQILFGNSKE